MSLVARLLVSRPSSSRSALRSLALSGIFYFNKNGTGRVLCVPDGCPKLSTLPPLCLESNRKGKIRLQGSGVSVMLLLLFYSDSIFFFSLQFLTDTTLMGLKKYADLFVCSRKKYCFVMSFYKLFYFFYTIIQKKQKKTLV